jgi:hypothetical protein
VCELDDALMFGVLFGEVERERESMIARRRSHYPVDSWKLVLDSSPPEIGVSRRY